MRDAERDRAIREQGRAARELLKRAEDAALRDEFTHATLTGTSGKLIALAFVTVIAATYIGMALYFATLGG